MNYKALRERIISIRNNGEKLNWRELAEEFETPLTTDRLVNYINGIFDEYTFSKNGDQTTIPKNEVFEKNEDGSSTLQKVIHLSSQQKNDEQEILKAFGYNEDNWTLVKYKLSEWQQGGEDGIKDLYSCQITIRPKNFNKYLTTKDIDKYFSTKKTIKIPKVKHTNYSKNGMVLEIDVADLHLGRRANKDEVNEDCSMEILCQKFRDTIDDICKRIGTTKLEKIYFVSLGDILNADNFQGSTTKGTPQDMECSHLETFNCACDLLIEGISKLATFAPLEIPYIAGNHDYVSGYMLFKSLEYYFKDNKNIIFDTRPISRKFALIGKNLVGWGHGEYVKKAKSQWLQVEAREEFGKARYVEVHLGHLHNLQTIEETSCGIIVRHLPSMVTPDNWTFEKGYVGKHQTTVSFLWDKEKGLQEIWYSNCL